MTQIHMTSPKMQKVAKNLRALYVNDIQPARQKVVIDAMTNLRQGMQEPGDVQKHPIQWDSAKQRRAFFASDGFGGGIPHVRTGAYQAGWHVFVDGLQVILRNMSKATKFIGGDAFGLVRSKINVPQNWPQLKKEFDAESATLADKEAEAVGAAIAKAFGR